MLAVEFQDVSKRFRVGRGSGVKDLLLGSRGQRHRSHLISALEGVSFKLQEGESVALLGTNGSGKSTTLKLLAGTILPSSGTVATRGRIAPMLELGAGFHPDLTGRENVFLNGAFLGLSRAYLRKNYEAIIEFAGIGDANETPVRFYSSGMYVRLGFAVAAHADPDIILIDEVLAVGDVEFQKKCLDTMSRFKRDGRTIVLVTHSFAQAASFTDRAIVLQGGKVLFDGGMNQARQYMEVESDVV